jgi:NAD(P)-dependent dehydrogenase (short-subunit alcohol dehydrogenase family)
MKKLTDVLLNGVIITSYLARHYFRLSPEEAKGDRNLVLTASCSAFYPAPYCPIYCAIKHGIVGMARSLAAVYYPKDGIRVNAVCPGTVRTSLLSGEEWTQFPVEYFTPVEVIVKAVLIFIDGKDDTDKGKEIKVMNAKVIECSGNNYYYRQQLDYCDEGMRKVMESTNLVEA